ncbi:MAG: PHP domain-containing protein [Clostridia bacterium]|nr:PHP domain-containing protein [Clostridia bacterium]
MRADLHIHSVFSDGLYTPREICERAKKAGLDAVSITDHDSMNGEEAKRAATKEFGLCYIPGWEISAYDQEDKIHITGYGCELGKAYQAFLELRKNLSYERAEDSIQKLKKCGISITIDKVKEMLADLGSPIHTFNICRAVERETGMPSEQVYLEYLAPKRPACSLIGRPTPLQAIECIHACGGVASIAHPGRLEMDFEKREKTIYALKEMGVDGIEIYYTTHTEKDVRYFHSLAEKYNLFATGGSDTHVEDGKHKIGTPNFTIPQKFLEKVSVIYP